MHKIQLTQGTTIEHSNSKFQGFAMHTKDFKDVRNAYILLRKYNPTATHIMCAFHIPGRSDPHHCHYSDDDETGGGGRAIFEMMQEQKTQNKAIFVLRHYDGINLGVDHFDLIKKAAKAAHDNMRQLRDCAHSGTPSTKPAGWAGRGRGLLHGSQQ